MIIYHPGSQTDRQVTRHVQSKEESKKWFSCLAARITHSLIITNQLTDWMTEWLNDWQIASSRRDSVIIFLSHNSLKTTESWNRTARMLPNLDSIQSDWLDRAKQLTLNSIGERLLSDSDSDCMTWAWLADILYMKLTDNRKQEKYEKSLYAASVLRSGFVIHNFSSSQSAIGFQNTEQHV